MKKYALLLLLVFIFASGGCGGGGSDISQDTSQDSEPATLVLSPLDSDGDGVPDIFHYYDSDYSDGRNAPSNGIAYDVPYLTYVHPSETDENGYFTADIYMKGSREYVIKYSHSGRALGDNDIDIRILTPDKKELVFDFGLAGSTEYEPAPAEAQESAEEIITPDENVQPPEDESPAEESTVSADPEILTVKARLEILPVENPCMIFYTFTAPQNGIYTFTVREKQYFPASDDVPYELRIYSSNDEPSLKLGNISMTSRDALHLQRMFSELCG